MVACFSDPTDVCACMCCGYPNGPFQLVFAQILLLAAIVLNWASLADCEFVTATVDGFNLPDFIPTGVWSDGARRGLGFFTWEALDGSCFWDGYNEDIAEWYFDILDDGWRAGRILGGMVFGFAWMLWPWSLSFTCSSQPKILRYALAAILVLICTPFQLSTLAAMGSSFCDEHECEIGRSAVMAIVSGLCFLISGVLFLMTKDYPGQQRDDHKPGYSAGQVVEQDEEMLVESGAVEHVLVPAEEPAASVGGNPEGDTVGDSTTEEKESS